MWTWTLELIFYTFYLFVDSTLLALFHTSVSSWLFFGNYITINSSPSKSLFEIQNICPNPNVYEVYSSV